MKLAKNEHKKLGIANSSIAGWGLFANEDIKKEDLIGEYIGEMVGIEDLNERSEYIDLEKTTYMFTLNDEYTVDSRTMGNILRFANHSKSKANAYAKIVFSKGNHKICLYASDDIKKGQEIFFDYEKKKEQTARSNRSSEYKTLPPFHTSWLYLLLYYIFLAL